MTVDVRIAHASAVIATKGVASSEVEAAVLHTHELASRLGDAGRLFPALWGVWLSTNGRGRYREALELAERLLAVAEPDGDSGRLLEAHHSLWTTMGAMGEAVAAIPHCERGIALYDPALHAPQARLYGGHDPGVCCRYQLALAHWFPGYPKRAAGAIQDALGRAEKLAQPLTMTITSTSAFLRYQMGDHDAARKTASR